MAKAFGEIDRFKTKDELLEEELAKFVSIHKPGATHMPVIRQFFKVYVTDGGFGLLSIPVSSAGWRIIPKVSLLKLLHQWRRLSRNT